MSEDDLQSIERRLRATYDAMAMQTSDAVPPFDVRRARDHRKRDEDRWARRMIALAACVVLVMVAAGAVLVARDGSQTTVATGSSAPPVQLPVAQLQVVAEETRTFELPEYVVPRPGPVRIALSGATGMTLTIAEHPEFTLGPTPSEPLSKTIELDPGVYHLESAIPGHTDAGLKATLIVQPSDNRSPCFDDPGPHTGSDGATYGPVPSSAPGGTVDPATLPDFVSVPCRTGEGIGGYARREDVVSSGVIAPEFDVYSPDGRTVVGHVVETKGFVALDENPDEVPASNSTTTTAPPRNESSSCGEVLPVQLGTIEGFDGPHPGPGPHALTPPAPGQLVDHWTSPTGSIEIRWPVDADAGVVITEPGQTGSGTTGVAQAPDANGYYLQRTTMRVGPETPLSCRLVQIDVRDVDSARADATTLLVRRTLVPPAPLIISSKSHVGVVPSAIECATPPGVAPVPKRGGTTQQPAFATPAEALRAFLATQPTLASTGYIEWLLPDGTRAYLLPAPASTGYVTVIRAAQTPAGRWTVTNYDASGC